MACAATPKPLVSPPYTYFVRKTFQSVIKSCRGSWSVPKPTVTEAISRSTVNVPCSGGPCTTSVAPIETVMSTLIVVNQRSTEMANVAPTETPISAWK